MGIDIYLNGYEFHEELCKAPHAIFDAAVKRRNSFPKDSPEAKEAQIAVNAAYDAMNRGSMGYLRSSYNSGGLFNVLEEIFGFSMASYLFPGDWESDQPIDGAEFVRKVENLQRTFILAMEHGARQLPFTEYFTEVSGQKAPDPHPAHVHGEEFGTSMLGMISKIAGDDKVEPAPRDAYKYLTQDHHWYLTTGLTNLLEFGMLAKRLNEAGTPTVAHISY